MRFVMAQVSEICHNVKKTETPVRKSFFYIYFSAVALLHLEAAT